jgi:hypothetical protein
MLVLDLCGTIQNYLNPLDSEDFFLNLSDFLLQENNKSKNERAINKKTHPNLYSDPKDGSPDDWNGRVRRDGLSDLRRSSFLRPKKVSLPRRNRKKKKI